MELNRTPNPLDRNARNGENDNWDIIEGETRKLNDKVDDFLGNLSEDAFNKVIEDIRLNWSHKVDNFSDLPSSPKKGDTVAVESDDMIYRYDGSDWIDVIPFTQFSAIAEIDNRLSSQLAETEQKAVLNLQHGLYEGKIVIFQDDDGSDRAISILKNQIFDPEGVPFSMCVNTSTIGNSGKLTVQDLLDLQEEGHTIFSHAHRHLRYGDEPGEVVEEDFKKSRDLLKEWGLRGYDILSYPHGSAKEPTRAIARKYYRAAFSVNRDDYNTMPLQQFYIHRHSMYALSLAEKKAVIDNAPENSLIVFFDHVAESHYDNQSFINEYRDLIQYIKSKNIPILNTEDALELKGNILDVGNTTKLFGADKQYVQIGRDGSFEKSAYNVDFDLVTPPTDFPKGFSHRFFNETDGNAIGLPESPATFINLRQQSDKYSESTLGWGNHQIVIHAYSDRIYKRRWRNGTWDDFKLINPYTIERSVNAHSASESITAYANHSITTFKFNSSGSDGFPTSSGIVTVYRLENHWSKMEVRAANANDSWQRHWNGNAWTEWKRSPILLGKATILVNETIPANSTVSKTLSLGSNVEDMVVTADPSSALPNNVFYNIFVAHDSKVITLKIVNLSSSSILLNADFHVKRIKYG